MNNAWKSPVAVRIAQRESRMWFDSYVTNVDRTARNTNMLMWHRRLWLIDHGAALYFHHRWTNYRERSRDPFSLIKDHVLLKRDQAKSVVFLAKGSISEPGTPPNPVPDAPQAEDCCGAGFMGLDIVTAMYAGNDGSLWLSAPPRIDRSREIPSLIFRYKDGKTASYSLADASLKFFVTAMAEDRNGVMWFGSNDGKLSTFSDSTFKPYPVLGMQSDLFLTGIYPDKDGLIWISGLGTAGLIRIQDGKATVHPGASGSLKGDLYSVVGDDIGNLWLNSSKGVLSFCKKEIAQSAAGDTSTLDPRIYGVADGMKSAKSYFIYGESPLKSTDGRIWFPTQRGVAVVDPAHMRINEIVPAVMIEEVVVGSEAIDLDRPIDLTPGIGTIQFRYSALSYTAVERVHFKYMLLGFDKDWIYAEQRREAFYTNLPPGQYQFHVIACNNDGIWNDAGASLSF